MPNGFSSRVQIGLRGRAILIVASLIVCSVLGASITSVLRTNSILKRNQDISIDGLGSGLASAIELPIAVGDTVELNRLAVQFMDLIPDAAFIRIEDPLGQRRALVIEDQTLYEGYLSKTLDTSRASVYTKPVETSISSTTDDSYFDLVDQQHDGLIEEQSLLGNIIIGTSNDGLREAQWAQWKSLMATMGIIMIIVLPMIFIIVGGWTSRLAQLIDNTIHISKGDYNRVLEDTKHDEIGQLVSAYESMRVAIRDRNESEQRRQKELLKAREEAVVANKAKSQFLAHMSHEIRTPINGVTGMLELLSMTQTTEQQRKHIRTAISSAEALLCLINDILDFSKIEAGHVEIESVPFDVHDILESVAEMLAHEAAEKDIELICDIDKHVPRMIIGDSTRVRQVLMNLVSNAIKFTDEGEVVIRATTASQDGESWLLRVAVLDTGIGIEPSQRNRLFKSFSQVDASTTRKFGGTGLGLAICKGFVELMQGQIGINPQRENGSEFWFTFRSGICREDRNITPVFRGVLSNMRAMIVDDNETNRAIYTEALTNWGLRADAYSSGPLALVAMNEAMAANDPFELVILDMQMPEMDGVQLADAIVSDESIDTPTMVMLTSMYHTIDKNDLENLSLAACLQKPIRLSTLHDALAHYMGGTQVHTMDQIEKSEDPKISLRGARALVAEDNSVNQLVIGELLKSFGVEAEIVNNGAEAISHADEGKYSFILMDCEMPVLDGFEATRWIRMQEQARADQRRIPIIALTANAFQGDRERCIDVGMDDYLTKPVNAKKLFATLAKWYDPELNPTESANTESIEQDAPEPERSGGDDGFAINHSIQQRNQPVIDLEGALSRCAGSCVVLCKVLEEFARVTDQVETELQSLVENKDFAGLIAQAHSLKGAAANIGADELASVAKDLEFAARESDAPMAVDALGQVISNLVSLRDGLPGLMDDLRKAA